MNSSSIIQLTNYENQWVAFADPDSKEIVGAGQTLSEAKEEARLHGYFQPIFYKVPPDAYFVPMV